MKSAGRFELIECSGTPYEIGCQWGEGCRESILRTLENSLNAMERYYQASAGDVMAMAMKFLPDVKKFDPYLVEIMRGQADATGLGFGEIFLQKCMNELTFYYTGMTGLCTSFAVTGKATCGSKTILGQNIDWIPGAEINLLKIRHADGLVQYTVSFANSTEYTFSSAGFGNCANATINNDYSFNIPLACYLPKVMRQKNSQAAMAILSEKARGLGYYHLADKNGHIAGVESVRDDFEILYPQRDILLHSNHYITERFLEKDTAMNYQPDSFPRLDRIMSLVEEHYGGLTPEVFMKILADHGGYPESICRHANESVPVSSATLASIIMVPSDGTIFIACGNPCENEYVKYCFD